MSNQEVATPRELLDAVELRFGSIGCDLAANATNRVVPLWFGPGGVKEDSLSQSWHQIGAGSTDGSPLLWLNPPFRNIAPWVQKCAEERMLGARIALLAPAAVCTNWFIDFVAPHAYVFELTPRVFKAEVRDCILALYTPERYVGRETWSWRSK